MIAVVQVVAEADEDRQIADARDVEIERNRRVLSCDLSIEQLLAVSRDCQRHLPIGPHELLDARDRHKATVIAVEPVHEFGLRMNHETALIHLAIDADRRLRASVAVIDADVEDDVQFRSKIGRVLFLARSELGQEGHFSLSEIECRGLVERDRHRTPGERTDREFLAFQFDAGKRQQVPVAEAELAERPRL